MDARGPGELLTPERAIDRTAGQGPAASGLAVLEGSGLRRDVIAVEGELPVAQGAPEPHRAPGQAVPEDRDRFAPHRVVEAGALAGRIDREGLGLPAGLDAEHLGERLQAAV